MMEVDPYVHAALLLKGLGKEITKDNVTSVIKAVGGDVDEAKAKVLEDALKGVNWDEALKVQVSAAPASAPAAKEEKKEEKPEEDEGKKEEEAAEGLANLFG